MASNETTICNLALGKLGAKTVMSLNDASPEARAAKLHYAATRDEVLRAHRWNFAIKRVKLTRLAEAPLFGWSAQYMLPADCLRVLQVNGYEETQREGRWEVEARRLLTSSACAKMKYVSRVTDCNLFDALFVKALALKLAAELAKPLTGSGQLAGDLLTEYERITGPTARGADVFEGRPKRKLPWVGSDFVRARGASFFFDGDDGDGGCECGDGVEEMPEIFELPKPPPADALWQTWKEDRFRRDDPRWKIVDWHFPVSPSGDGRYHSGCVNFVWTSTTDDGTMQAWDVVWSKQPEEQQAALLEIVSPRAAAGEQVFAVEYYGSRTVSGGVGAWVRVFTPSSDNYKLYELQPLA